MNTKEKMVGAVCAKITGGSVDEDWGGLCPACDVEGGCLAIAEAVLDELMEPGEGIINAEYERRYDGCVGVDENQAKAVIKRDWQAMLQAMKEGK